MITVRLIMVITISYVNSPLLLIAMLVANVDSTSEDRREAAINENPVTGVSKDTSASPVASVNGVKASNPCLLGQTLGA